MKLSQANSYFNSVPVDGWDGSAWVAAVAYGDFMAFDRFITERSFGQKKRMFEVGGSRTIPAQYEVVRTPDGRRYMVVADNKDIEASEVYGTTYLLQEAQHTFSIVRNVPTVSASGLPNGNTPTVVATGFCDLERYSAENSREFDTVKYSSHVIVLPASVALTPDDQIIVDDTSYAVTEVNSLLKVKEVRALKRGTAPPFP